MEPLILEALKDMNKLPQLLSEKSDEEKASFTKSLVEYTSNKVKDECLEGYVTSLLEGTDTTIKPSNPDLFREAQDSVVNFYGELDANTLGMGIYTYICNGGAFEGVNKPVTMKDVFAVEGDEGNETLTIENTDEFLAGEFAGEGILFPTGTKHYTYTSLQLVESYKGEDKELVLKNINKAANKYGLGTSTENKIEFYPIMIEQDADTFYAPMKITCKEELEQVKTELDSVKETYSLNDEQFTNFEKFLTETEALLEKTGPLLTNEECNATPISLPTSFFVEYFINRESNDVRKYLVPLVGLIRQGKITKDVVEKADKVFNVFGTLTLEKWLGSVPDKIDTSSGVEDSKESTITQIPSQVAGDGSKAEETVTQRSDSDVYKSLCRKKSPRGSK